ncbi:hypothetical protein AVEN_268156-1 [Araneus ventricosus]|uniref:Uncharacterized protein n=1 Tax=Araneus ventricosus TaxID=182803 RepID=A0A4Y2LU62_ARAVE|nr:hypothetical protein AVEN_268156-1 [Araneus ventricosus]
MLEDRLLNYEDEDAGWSTFNILPRASTQPCYWKREEILFFSGHGPFPSYLKRFNLASTANCPCGNTNGIPCSQRRSYGKEMQRLRKLLARVETDEDSDFDTEDNGPEDILEENFFKS